MALLGGGFDGDAILGDLDLAAAGGVGDALHLGHGHQVAVLGGSLCFDGDQLLLGFLLLLRLGLRLLFGGLRLLGRCGFPFRIFRRTVGSLFLRLIVGVLLDVLFGHAGLLGVGLHRVEVPHEGLLIDGAVLVQEVGVAQDQLEVALDVVAVALELSESLEQLVHGLSDLGDIVGSGLLHLLDSLILGVALLGCGVGLLLEGFVLVALLLGLDVLLLSLVGLVVLSGLIGEGGVLLEQEVLGAALALLVLLGGVRGGLVLGLLLSLLGLSCGGGQLLGLALGGQSVLVLDLHCRVEFECALIRLGESLADLTDHLVGALRGLLGAGDVLRGGDLGKFGHDHRVGGALRLALLVGVGGSVSHQVGKRRPDERGRHDGGSHCCHREIAAVFHGSSSLIPHWVQRSRMGWPPARTTGLGDPGDEMGNASEAVWRYVGNDRGAIEGLATVRVVPVMNL